MLLILEGQSKAGKTTLAQALLKEAKRQGYKCEITKFKRTDDPVAHMREHMLPLAYDEVLHIVDRAHLTEVVMTTLYQRPHTWAPSDMTALDEDFFKAGAALVLVEAFPHTVEERERSEGREPEGLDVALTGDAFRKAYYASACGICTVNTSRSQATEFNARAVLDLFKRMKKNEDLS